MIQVIAEYPEVAILEDEQGKFIFSRHKDEIIDVPRLPVINKIPQSSRYYDTHRDIQAMLN